MYTSFNLAALIRAVKIAQITFKYSQKETRFRIYSNFWLRIRYVNNRTN